MIVTNIKNQHGGLVYEQIKFTKMLLMMITSNWIKME